MQHLSQNLELNLEQKARFLRDLADLLDQYGLEKDGRGATGLSYCAATQLGVEHRDNQEPSPFLDNDQLNEAYEWGKSDTVDVIELVGVSC